MITASPNLYDFSQPSWRSLCSSLNAVVAQDSPSLLDDYLAARPEELTEVDPQGNNLLMLMLKANALECAYHLIRNYSDDIDFEHLNNSKQTALFLACEAKAENAALELIRQGASMFTIDVRGYSPFHVAVHQEALSIITLSVELALANNNLLAAAKKLFKEKTATPLHLAAKSCPEALESVLGLKPDVNMTDGEGMTPLHHAAAGPRAIQNTERLLASHADTNLIDTRGRTPLLIACFEGNKRLIDLLLMHGADPNLGTPTPLLQAYLSDSIIIFEKLLVKKAKTDCKIGSYQLLELFSALNETAFIEQLLRYGAEPTLASEEFAECHRQANAVLSQFSPRVKKQSGKSLFSRAKKASEKSPQGAENQKPDDFEKKDDNGKTPFFICCEKGSVNQLLRLLANSNPITKDKHGNNVIHAALNAANRSVFFFLIRHFKELINEPNRSGEYPLHLAVKLGDPLSVFLLLKFGKNPNVYDQERNTPLHLISSARTSDDAAIIQIMDWLIFMGAKIESMNQRHETPLHSAWNMKNSTVFHALLKRGASPDTLDADDKTLLVNTCELGNYSWAEHLLRSGANQNAEGKTTPLYEACRSENLNLVSLLLSAKSGGANPDKRVDGNTPLSLTLQRISMNRSKEKQQELLNIFRELLRHGANPDKSFTWQGKALTPLAFSTLHLLIEPLKILLEAGCDVNKKTRDVSRPVKLAAYGGSIEILSELLAYSPIITKKLKQAKGLSDEVRKKLILKPIDTQTPPLKKTQISTLSRSILFKEETEPAGDFKKSNKIRADDDPERLTLMHFAFDEAMNQKAQNFDRVDTLEEDLMRSHKMITGRCLLKQLARKMPASVGRLEKSMDIFIQGEKVISTDMKFMGKTRDQKAAEIASKLLKAINALLGEDSITAKIEDKVRLLSKMDAIDEKAILQLNIYADRELLPINRDLIALKLVTKECALISILPVQTQISNYANLHRHEVSLMPMLRDQWESIDINRTKDGFVATGHTHIKIRAKEKGEPKEAASLKITSEMSIDENTGKMTLAIHRSNLKFQAGISPETKQHIYAAIDSPITYNTTLI